MKKRLFIVVCVFLIFISCGGIKTTNIGLENESYLEFIGNPGNYSGGVDVLIDDKIAFKAEIVKDLKRNVSRVKGGKAYVVSTGTHIVAVSYNNNLIMKKQIFISAQETKKFMLP